MNASGSQSSTTGSYRVRRVALADVPADVEADWREFLKTWDRADIIHEIDWLRTEWADQVDNLFALLVDRDGRLTTIVPFVVKSWPLPLRLGELQLAQLPLKRLCLIGVPALPEDADVYEAVFRELLATEGYDAIFFEMVPQGSYLHRYLGDNDAVRRGLRRYSDGGFEEYHRIRFPPTAEAYFKKFSSKTRSTQRRKIRKLDNDHDGSLVCQRYDSLEGFEEFCRSAVDVSQRSYQWHLLGQGLRDVDKYTREMRSAAERGWLRAYLLRLGDRSIAFMIGYQYNGIYHYKEVGFDQDLRKYSPGTILQVMVIDDLYAHDTPRTFEFGVHGEQKAAFGNESTEAERVFLVKRSFYPEVAAGAHRVWHRTTDLAVEGLERLGIKKKMKSLARRLSVPSN